MASTAKELAKMRANWVRERDRSELARVRAALRAARLRRREAMRAALAACKRARLAMRERIKAYRAEQLARINDDVRVMRNAARAQCQARRHRIREAARPVLETRRAEAVALARYQKRIEQATAQQRRRKLSTARERREEDDDTVRGNLPPELVPVFDRVRRSLRPTKRQTRTEAFLEWAESHPEDVIAYQGDETDREVRRLIAEHEAAERQLRKTSGRAARKRAAGDVPF